MATPEELIQQFDEAASRQSTPRTVVDIERFIPEPIDRPEILTAERDAEQLQLEQEGFSRNAALFAATQGQQQERGAEIIGARPGGVEGGDIEAVVEAATRALSVRKQAPDFRRAPDEELDRFIAGEDIPRAAGGLAQAIPGAELLGRRVAAPIAATLTGQETEEVRQQFFGTPAEQEETQRRRAQAGLAGAELALAGAGQLLRLPGQEAVRSRFSEAKEELTPKTVEGTAGLPLETPEFALLRIGGGLIASPIQEAIARVPVPTLPPKIARKIGSSLAAAGGLLDPEQIEDVGPIDLFETAPLEEAVFGTTPEARGLVSDVKDRGTVATWLVRSFEKIERGHGLIEDFDASVVERFGEDAAGLRKAAMVGGFLGDVLIPWEFPVTKPIGLIGRAAKTAKALKVPDVADVSSSKAFLQVLGGREADLSDAIAESFGDAIARGEDVNGTLDGIPEFFRQTMENMANTTLGRSLNEVVEQVTGKGLPPTPLQDANAARFRQAEGEFMAEAAEVPIEQATNTLIPFQPRSMPEYLDYIHGESKRTRIQGLRGEAQGAEMLRWLDPEQTPATKAYHVIGSEGTVATGNLETAIRIFTARQNLGDEIWFRDHRITAGWRKRAKGDRPVGSIVHNFDFSTDAEKGIIQAVREANPRATMSAERVLAQKGVRAQGVVKPGEVDAQLAVNRTANFFLNGVENAARRPALADPARELVDLVRDSYRSWLRSQRGHHRLVNMNGQVWVTPGEIAPIRRGILEAQDAAGLGRGSFGIEKGALQLSEAQTRGAEKMAARFGVVFDKPGVVTEAGWTRMHDAMVRKFAGRSADARWAIRGTGPLSDELIATVADLAKARPDQVVSTGSQVGREVFSNFFNIDRVLLPVSTRRVLDAATRGLSRIGEEVLLEVRAAIKNGDSPTDALHRIALTYRPIPERELDNIDAILRLAQDGITPEQPFLWRKRVLMDVKDIDPQWALTRSDDPVESIDGLITYAKQRRVEVVKLAQWVVESAIPQVKRADLADRFRNIAEDDWVALWRGFVQDGGATPRLDETLGKMFGKGVAVEPPRNVNLKFVMRLKAEEKVQQAVEALIDADLTVSPGTRTRQVVSDLLAGVAPTRDAAGRFTHGATESEVAHATNLIRRWGLDQQGPSGVGLETFGGIEIPATLGREIERMRVLGVDNVEALLAKNKQISAFLYRNYKQSLTAGMVVPNPAYHVGNVLGIIPMLLTTRGTIGTARSLGATMQHAPMVRELNRRLSNFEGLFRPSTLDGRVFVTDTGMTYSVDALEELTRRFGVDTTQANLETARSIAEELDRLEPGSWGRLKAGFAGWQDALMEAASAPERAVRIGTFLDELKRGSAPEAAAEAARRALYDYSELTDFEHRVMRKAFTFYAFMRKNLDAFFRGAVNNPERIGQQLRFFRDQRQVFGQGDVETTQASQDDLTRLIMWEIEGEPGVGVLRPDGTFDRRYRSIFMSTTPLGSPEAMFQLHDLVTTVTGAPALARGEEGAEEPIQRFIGELNPLFQLPVKLTTKIDPGTGWSMNSPAANEIPPFMMEIPGLRSLTIDLFDPHPVQIKEGGKRDPDRASMQWLGEPSVWVAGNKPGWQTLKQFFGRNLRTLQTNYQVYSDFFPNNSLQVRPWSNTTIDLMEALGLKADPQLTEAFAQERLKRDEKFRVRERVDELEARTAE